MISYAKINIFILLFIKHEKKSLSLICLSKLGGILFIMIWQWMVIFFVIKFFSQFWTCCRDLLIKSRQIHPKNQKEKKKPISSLFIFFIKKCVLKLLLLRKHHLSFSVEINLVIVFDSWLWKINQNLELFFIHR